MATTKENRTFTHDVGIRPDALAELVQTGSTALQEGNLTEALDIFQEVVNAFPDRPEGHNNLGALYSSLGDLAKAEACFDKVISLLPDNPNVLYNRGVVRSRLEKFDGARADFRAVMESCPNDVDTLNNLGVTDYMQGHLDDAATHFKAALKIKPDYAGALVNLCDVELARGATAQAVAICDDYLRSYSNLEVRRKQFEILSSGCREAIDKASRTAESLLAWDTDNPQVRQELGRLIQARTVLNEAAAV